MDSEDDVIANNEELTETLEKAIPNELATKEEVIAEIEACFKREKNLTERLSFTALKFIRQYFFRDTIGDYTSDDVVNNVLAKIISGKRRWNKQKFPDIPDFIRISILSYVRNEKKRKEEFESVDICNEDGELEEWKHKDYILACFNNDLTNGLLDTDRHQNLSDQLFLVLGEDVYATFVLEKRLDGIKSNIIIAENLGLEVREVENALKRIRRKYFEIINQRRE